MGQTTNLPDPNKYLHGAAFSLAQSTWIYSTRKVYLQSRTGIIEEKARNILPNIQAKTRKHLDQTSNNKRSTRPTPDKSSDKEFDPVT